MRALIVHDAVGASARPDEEDSLVQARAVGEALRGLGIETPALAFGADLERMRAELVRLAPDVVFNLVESVAREGRFIHVAPSLFESLGLAFTGSGSEAMFLSSSKLATKRVLAAAGLPTPEWHGLSELERPGRVLAAGSYLLKSVWEHGSLGIDAAGVARTHDASTLRASLLARLPMLGGEGFAEAYVEGREFNVALLDGQSGPRCLPIPEIRFERWPDGLARVVDYAAKWTPGSATYERTPRVFAEAPGDARLFARLRELALATFEAFGLAGWARVDFRVDASGEPMVIDVNANPCLTPDAGFAAALEQAGIGYASALRSLLDAALRRHGRR